MSPRPLDFPHHTYLLHLKSSPPPPIFTFVSCVFVSSLFSSKDSMIIDSCGHTLHGNLPWLLGLGSRASSSVDWHQWWSGSQQVSRWHSTCWVLNIQPIDTMHPGYQTLGLLHLPCSSCIVNGTQAEYGSFL